MTPGLRQAAPVAVLQFLFAAVIIDEHRAPRGTFDYSRIEIDPIPSNPCTASEPGACRLT
jgi:hypothetical protein